MSSYATRRQVEYANALIRWYNTVCETTDEKRPLFGHFADRRQVSETI